MRRQFKVRPIEARTKGEIRRLRRAGFVPVSIQHRGQETLHLQEEAKPLDDFILHHSETAMLELVMESGNQRHTVMVHDVQRDPISNTLLHVTFQEVVSGELMKTHVPIVFRGEPEAVRQKSAAVQHPTDTVEVRALPQDLPDHFTVDISNLVYGDVVRVSDLSAGDKIEMLTAPDTVLVSLVTIRANLPEETGPVAEETPAPVEAAAEA